MGSAPFQARKTNIEGKLCKYRVLCMPLAWVNIIALSRLLSPSHTKSCNLVTVRQGPNVVVLGPKVYYSYDHEGGHTEKYLHKTRLSGPAMKCKINLLSCMASRKTSRTTATTDPTTCRGTSRDCRKSSRAISRLVPYSHGTSREVARLVLRSHQSRDLNSSKNVLPPL